MHLWAYKSNYISLFYEVELSSLSALYKYKEFVLWDGITILRIYKFNKSQKCSLNTSLERQGIKRQKKKGLNTTQRNEMQR